jgi:hypothetical protein
VQIPGRTGLTANRVVAQIAGKLLIERARRTRLDLEQLTLVMADVIGGVHGHLLLQVGV